MARRKLKNKNVRESTKYQNNAKELLIKYFDIVKTEWSVSKESVDRFKLKSIYAPRLDVAVGPFNIGDNITVFDIEQEHNKSPKKLKEYVIRKKLKMNINPRCTLAIEVVFSGSSKHILGDMTNASVMGLYGFVVASDKMYEKVHRIYNYTQVIKSLDKIPKDLFNNISILNITDFKNLLK